MYKGIKLINVAKDVDVVVLAVQVKNDRGDMRRTQIISERSNDFTNYISFTNIGTKIIFNDNKNYDFNLLT